MYKTCMLIFSLFCCCQLQAQTDSVDVIEVAEGWAGNSVNTTIFRKNSLTSHNGYQYIAFYDPDQYVVLGKRKHGSAQWKIQKTPYQGNATDAHNSISIMIDGDGYLHVSWDHHNTPLRYAKGLAPGSLELSGELTMTGQKESSVSYPEFYRLPGGDLLFFYRNGASGNGELVINRYEVQDKTWTQVQENLIDGEGARNAYWQACVDSQGVIHLSWVWRETWDVASNHDLSYARSKDGGLTWENSIGELYELPITMSTAEVALEIPQNSELINQTAMTTDRTGQPIIATYWRPEDSEIPQYQVIYLSDGQWKSQVVSDRTTPFSLSGGGTKRIPISRPQILMGNEQEKDVVLLIFRDLERGSKPSVLINRDFPDGTWNTIDLMEADLGSWEPTYDTQLWKEEECLSLFVQKVDQVDGEGLSSAPPEIVKVLEWNTKKLLLKPLPINDR